MHELDHRKLRVAPGADVRLADYDPAQTCSFPDAAAAREKLESDVARLGELQDVFYASRAHALLVIFQGMDAAGKDSAIKHVMTGVNPQGVQVTSFKAPSADEIEHDFLWRHVRELPRRGHIGIFNRSHYEEVLVVRVHPALLERERLPGGARPPHVWRDRFEDINAFERHLARNGTLVVKFFLHVSSEEQRRRLLARIDTPSKNWKFDAQDLQERAAWKDYMHAYESALAHTSTDSAPWYVVPADHKWVTRVVVADVLCTHLAALNLSYPSIDDTQRQVLLQARAALTEPSPPA